MPPVTEGAKTPKIHPAKKAVLFGIAEYLDRYDIFENVTITRPGKEITFEIDDTKFVITLDQRKPKN